MELNEILVSQAKEQGMNIYKQEMFYMNEVIVCVKCSEIGPK